MKLEKRDGYTQENMANKLNVARTTYTGYENGNFSPSLEMALQIKKILNYKKDDIFFNFKCQYIEQKQKQRKGGEIKCQQQNYKKKQE